MRSSFETNCNLSCLDCVKAKQQRRGSAYLQACRRDFRACWDLVSHQSACPRLHKYSTASGCKVTYVTAWRNWQFINSFTFAFLTATLVKPCNRKAAKYPRSANVQTKLMIIGFFSFVKHYRLLLLVSEATGTLCYSLTFYPTVMVTLKRKKCFSLDLIEINKKVYFFKVAPTRHETK